MPSEDTQFKPGQSGNPAGKKPGTPDKKFTTLAYWFKLIEEGWDKADTDTQMKVATEMVKMILGKRPLPPETPEQSAQNADAVFKAMNDLTEAALKGAKANGDGNGNGPV